MRQIELSHGIYYFLVVSYVRQESIKEFKPIFQKQFTCYTGVADLYVYFYEKAIQLLKDGGSLAYISSNKWFRANYGVPLRKYISQNCQIHTIVDFGELSVFSAATFPMIFIASKQKVAKQSPIFTQVKSLDPPYPDVQALVSQTIEPLPETAINGSEWMLTNSGIADVIKKMEKSGIPLGEYVNGNIYRGVLTGFNEAFIITTKQRDKLIAEDPKSSEIIKPLAIGDCVRKWNIRESDKWLLFIPWHFPLHQDKQIVGVSNEAEREFKKRYPAIYSHLLKYKNELSERNQAETGIRYEWYALQRCAASYYNNFEKPKIIFPDIAKESRFAFDYSGCYIGNTAYIIPDKNLFLLGVLNSTCVWAYAKENFSCLGDPDKGGRFRFISQSVVKIPIPTAGEGDRVAIEELVQKCLDAKGQNVKQWEQEIDAIVARLYGLSEDEMKIIRGEK